MKKRSDLLVLTMAALVLAACSEGETGAADGQGGAEGSAAGNSSSAGAGPSEGGGGNPAGGGTAGATVAAGGAAGTTATGGAAGTIQAGGSAGAPPAGGCVLNLLPALAPVAPPALAGPSSSGEAGLLDGVMSWAPPATPDGLVPQQSWYSTGSTPNGDIYFSSADHVTNSALYKIGIADDVCSYVGDARAASQAVNNWMAGESAQKFHVRPTYYQGRVYVATTDFSDPNAGYLNHRGFHWYAYDEARATLLDLSVDEPNGVAVQNFQCMAMTLDDARGTLYCLGTPNGNLYQYNIEQGTSVDLGRPTEVVQEFLTVGRYMWIDAEGVVYFSYSGINSVFAYDPLTSSFAPKTDWDLGGLEIKFGQWSPDHKRCYLGDYEGRLYLFDDDAGSFTLIGQATVPAEYNTTEPIYVWQTRLFQISADERAFYFMNEWSAGAYALFQYDLQLQTTTKIAELSELDSGLPGPYLGHSAYNSWDTKGRFAYVNFNMVPTDAMRATRIDPVRVKVARGLLPELVTVSVALEQGRLTVSRTGDATAALDVILSLSSETQPDAKSYRSITVPPGAASFDVTAALGQQIDSAAGQTLTLAVVPNGNTYVTSDAMQLRFVHLANGPVGCAAAL